MKKDDKIDQIIHKKFLKGLFAITLNIIPRFENIAVFLIWLIVIAYKPQIMTGMLIMQMAIDKNHRFASGDFDAIK